MVPGYSERGYHQSKGKTNSIQETYLVALDPMIDSAAGISLVTWLWRSTSEAGVEFSVSAAQVWARAGDGQIERTVITVSR
jgi:hypothetical protein